MHLSIIVPIYNENSILCENISKIHECFDKKFNFEIIVVDDGSIESPNFLLSKLNYSNLKIINNQKNFGKGYSIIQGIRNSNGYLVLITDADLSSPINEYFKLEKKIKDGYDFVIGSRAKNDSEVIIKQNILRIIMGEIFNICVRLILGLKYNDTQCGLKLFNGEKIKYISTLCKINRFCIDAEILFLAKKFKYNVFEKGIIWINDKRSSVNLFYDPLIMFIDLFRIRLRNYDEKIN